MTVLTIDIGNTFLKAGVFADHRLVEIYIVRERWEEKIASILAMHRPSHSILCSVGNDEALKSLEPILSKRTQFLHLNATTPLPFTSDYDLLAIGMDRLANAAAAIHFFPGRSCLVIDSGSCVTYDLVNTAAHHLGGAISPGMEMRFKSMQHYTSRLPLAHFHENNSAAGTNTEESLQNGVFYGMVDEMNGMIARYEKMTGNLQVLLCGGDATKFDKHLKKGIFANPYLLLYGLNKILIFNVVKNKVER